MIDLHNLSLGFVRNCAKKFKSYSTAEVSERIAGIQQQDEKIEDIDILDIKQTLRDLYRTYHIDIDLMKAIDQNIKSLSEASERMINIAANLDQMRQKRPVSN